MQKKTLNGRALTFLAIVLLAAAIYQVRAQAEKPVIRPWLHLISI